MIRIEETVELIGERMLARSLDPTQYPALREILSDPKTMAHMQFMSNHEQGGWSLEALTKMLDLWKTRQKAGLGVYFTLLDLENHVIGMCILSKIHPMNRSCEFGIVLHHPHWGKAYSLETHLLILGYALERLGFHRIEFVMLEENARMQGFLKKIGVRFEAIKEDAAFENGEFKNDAVYRCLAPEWPSIKSNLENILASFPH